MRRVYLSLIALFCLLAILDSLFVNSSGWPRVVWGAVGYSGLALICIFSRLKRRDIGLSRSQAGAGLRIGLEAVGIILLGLAAIFAFNATVFKDPRHQQTILSALLSAFFQIPLLTVLFEELTFRGIVPALLYRIHETALFSAIWSSILFGLWHIPSATTIGSYRITSEVIIPRLAVIAAVVAFTSLAGLVLCWLRFKSNSLLAPVLAHWGVNAFALILAAASWHN